MALVLNATPGDVSANSYCSVVEADLYLSYHPQVAVVWVEYDAQEKKIPALVTATRWLDEQYHWKGYKTTEGQALRWPRSGVEDRDGYTLDFDTIPVFLKHATAELARYIAVKDREAELDDASAGLRSVTAGEVSVQFEKSDRFSVFPSSITKMIEPYLDWSSGGATVKLTRV